MTMPSRSRNALLSITLAAALAAPVVAQQIRGQRLPPGQDVKDLNAVYVRDSGVASERMALAERMERLKEWDKSAAVYQEITDKYADRLIPTRTDETGQVQQYVSVSAVVQERLARWPEDGLRVYRGLYEDTARDRLAKLSPGDRPGLQQIFGQYFATESGKEAGLRLVRDSVERGEFSAAAWAGRRLLALHPTLTVERPGLIFLSAIAEHLAGNAAAAETYRQTLASDHADAVAPVRGKDVNLADALAVELKQPAVTRGARLDAWPLPYGSPDNAALPSQVSFGGARMFAVDLVAPRPRGASSAAIKQYADKLRDDARRGALTGVMPVVDRGELFFQDNARVYAVSLSSGLPLTGWGKPYVAESATPTPPGTPLPVAVTDDSVVALMSNHDKNAAQMLGRSTQPQLVVLDRGTGKVRWSITAGGLKVGNDDARLTEGQFYGVPSVVGDTVYVLVRATPGRQFREVHAVALSLADGSVKWNSYLASTASNSEFNEIEGEVIFANSAAQLAYADGRLYVLSNIGAIGCFDASNGKTEWLNVYPRTDAIARQERRYIGERAIADKPFVSNPPIVADGKLFVMPSDSPSILVYDAASGEQIAALPRTLLDREDKKFDPVEMLLGVVDGEMILGTRTAILAVPWQKYDATKNLPQNEGRYKKIEAGDGSDLDAISGRPFVTDQHVFVPRVDKLYRVSIERMGIEGLYPQSGNWDAETETPGNVIATPDYLIVAGHNRVAVYADFAVAAAKLDEQIAREPAAAEPKLRYAELMFVGGKPRDALGWLDQAIATLGGEKNLPHGALRDRLFDLAVNYAAKQPVDSPPAVELSKQLFARARLAADTPPQQVRYRQAHAAARRAAGDGAGELALHREILANADWRRVPVSGKGGTATAAGDAEVAVVELAKLAPTAYATFAADADARYASVSATKPATNSATKPDTAALIELADAFPSTAAAQRAIADAAESYEANNQPRVAGQTLRRLLKYVGGVDRTRALESLTRVYLGMPGQLDAAIVRVDQLKQQSPAGRLVKPVRLEGGREIKDVSYAQLADELRGARRAAVDASLPTFGLRPSSGGGAKKPEPPLLLPPEKLVGVAGIVPQEGRPRPDRVVIWQDDDKINQLAAGGVAPLHPPVPLPGRPRSAIYAGDTLIAVGGNVISAISPAGLLLWQVPLAGLPDAEITRPDASPEAEVAVKEDAAEDEPIPRVVLEGRGIRRGNLGIRNGGGNFRVGGVQINDNAGDETIAHVAVLSDRVVFATQRGRVAAIDLAGGRVVWQMRSADESLRRMAATEDFVAVATGEDGGATDVAVLDTINGQTLRRTTYDAARGQRFVNLALSPGGTLVTMLNNRLLGRDLYDAASPGWERPASANVNDAAYANSGGEKQLVIADDRVLAVATVNGQQHVRAYELSSGKPLMARGGKPDVLVEAAFTAAASPGNETLLSITTVGPVFYVYTPVALSSYHLDKKDWRWSARVNATSGGAFRDLLLSRDYAVLVNPRDPANNAEKVPSVQLNVYSRALSPSGNESGLLERYPKVTDAAGIVVGQWQLAEGAFYYVAGNKTLTMLKPGR